MLLFTVAIYARPQDVFPSVDALHLPLVFGFSAGVTYLSALVSRHASFYLPRELAIVVLLTLWYALGIPFALWRGGSLQLFDQVWLKTLFAFFLLTQTVTTIKRVRLLVWTIIVSEFAVVLVTLIQSRQANWQGERLAGFNQGILGWNYFGIALAMAIPYIAVLFLTGSFLRTCFLAGMCFPLMWMLILTASRGGVLTVALSLILTFALLLRHRVRGRIVFALVALALVVALVLAPEVLWTRLSTLWSSSTTIGDQVSASAEESTQQRIVLLLRSCRYTLNHPFLGLGMGNFLVASGAEVGDASGWYVTHDTFTQVSSEAGIPALLLFIALFVTVLRRMRRKSSTICVDREQPEVSLLARATIVSLLAFCFGSLFASMAYDYYAFYPIAIGVGLQMIPLKRGRTASPDKAARKYSLFY
jgi:putative inorganic carbon (hco3(-)) transporter